MSAVQAATVTPRSVGEVVEWKVPTHPVFRGVVIERGTPEESVRVDELMGRPAGGGWDEFGALLRVRCTNGDCSCQPGSTWCPGWLHSVNESQVHTPGDDVAVALW